MTNDVGYVTPCFVDYILPNTRVKFDINTASFTNPTVAPLYGRYKVKYLAFWAPHRLYMREWHNGSAVEPGDEFYYPLTVLDNKMLMSDNEVINLNHYSGFNDPEVYFNLKSGNGMRYVPPTSLTEYLGIYPAMTCSADFIESGANVDTNLVTFDTQGSIFGQRTTIGSNAFSFLAFWDIYRNFIANVQEEYFPVRVNSFTNSVKNFNGTEVYPGTGIRDILCTRKQLDMFFDEIKSHNSRQGNYIIDQTWDLFMGFDIYPFKRVVYTGNVPESDQTLSFWYDWFMSRQVVSPVAPDFFMYISNEHNHYGQPFAPYMPDAFSSWISNENVELERSKSKVIVNNNEFTMEQWKIASRIQNMVRKSLFKNSDFAEYMDVQYGVRPSTGITKPMFLGAFVSDIIFNDVISSAQTGDGSDPQANDALGSRAGYGNGRDTDKKNFVDFTSKEPGTFMVLQIILPEVFYFEGRDLMYDKQNFNEEFNPEFDAIGYQDLQRTQMNFVPGLERDPYGRLSYGTPITVYNTAVAQQPYAMEHMVKYNQLKGMMTMPNYYQRWTLARSFNYNRGNLSDRGISPNRTYYSTYPFPEMYNNIFQNELRIDNFQFYLNFDYLKYQPISKQFLSFN